MFNLSLSLIDFRQSLHYIFSLNSKTYVLGFSYFYMNIIIEDILKINKNVVGLSSSSDGKLGD